MPELPEVEVVKNSLLILEDERITSTNNFISKMRHPVPNISNLKGDTIERISRRGKYIIINFKDSDDAIIHLGMSGHILLNQADIAKHTILRIKTTNYTMDFIDPRRFGFFIFSKDAMSERIITKMAPEPFSEEFKFDDFYQACKNKKYPIKKAVMDNTIIVGAGNIYANESLYRARIHPNRRCDMITKKQYKKLFESVLLILKEAIDAGGSSIQDFYHTDGENGNFQKLIQVYGKAGEMCPRCDAIIQKMEIGKRSSFFCGSCTRTPPAIFTKEVISGQSDIKKVNLLDKKLVSY